MKNSNEEKPTPTKEEILQSLKSNSEVQKYIEQFRPETTEIFLDHYAQKVSSVLEYGPFLEEREKEMPFQFLNSAEKLMWEIQQKKLFNLQCLWRAEQIEIPGLESCQDFRYWEYYIQSCPFVEPITQDEVDMYINYLLSGQRIFDNERGIQWSGYQDYETYKEERKNPEEGFTMPDWYHFYDVRKGTSSLLILPDIRGEKEDFYIQIWVTQGRKEYLAKQQEIEKLNLPPEDPRPWIHFDNHALISFAEKFGDEQTRKYLKQEIKSNENYEYKYDVSSDIFFLNDIDEYISFEPHYDWREQVRLTVLKYKNEKIAEAMPAAFESYKMRMETGIGYPHQIEYVDHGDGVQRDVRHTVLETKECVLKGRFFNGEARDWDF